MTRTCHRAPTTAPIAIELTPYSQLKTKERPLDTRLAIGPLTSTVAENVTTRVISGMQNSLIVSGMYFLKSFSNHAANATAQITGITLLA